MQEDEGEPAIVEQAAEPVEGRALSRRDRWMEQRSSVGCAVFLTAFFVTVALWALFTFR